MKSIFRSVFHESLALRRELNIPPIAWIVWLIISILVLYVSLAIIVGPENRRELQFVSERGAITVLSGIFLAMASGFAGVAFFLFPIEISWSRCFWLLATLGLGFFALDEFLEFHERMDAVANFVLGPPQTFRKWNDVIVIGYGAVGIICAISFIREIFRYQRLAEMLITSFVFYFIHTVIDSTQEPPTTVSIILEETAKLFSSSFLAFSMFVGLLGVIALADFSRRQ